MASPVPRLWLPDSAKAAFYCRACKAEFTERERVAYTEHVIRCAEDTVDEFAGQRAPLQGWNTEVDPEWGEYNRELQRRGVDPDRQYDPVFKKSAKRLRES